MTLEKQLCVFNVLLSTTVLLICVQLTKAEHCCTFDDGLCTGWSQNYYHDDFNWTNNFGPTPSSDTGPSSDHGIHGSYMYIETSFPRQYGENAKLEFSVSSPDIGKLSCLKFYYHMYGEAINTLNVYNGNNKAFNQSGNQGDLWMRANVTMILENKVTFEGICGDFFTGDIAIDDVSILDGICQECTEKVNRSFGKLDIRYTSKFDPYCNWIVGDAGIPQAVAIVSVHQMNLRENSSEYIKMFDGNGTEVFALYGGHSMSNNFQYISFGESKSITIQVSLIDSWSSVKIDHGTMKQRLDLASVVADWNITVVSRTARSIGVSWGSPASLGGIRFYFAFARKTNSSSKSISEIKAENITALEIKDLEGFREYKVAVVAVSGDGTPFKSADVSVMTSEGVPGKAPNDVEVTSFDFTSDLLVEWEPLPQQYANGIVLGYIIYFRENQDYSSYKSVYAIGHSATKFTLTDLKPGHQYQVAVTAFTSKGEGPWSDFSYVTTGCFVIFNATFGQIELKTTSNDLIRCNWTMHSEAVAFIAVQEINLDDCSEFVKIIDGNGTGILYHPGCVPFYREVLAHVSFGLSNNISIQAYTERPGNTIMMKFAILTKGLESAIPVSGWNVSIFHDSPTRLTLQWMSLDTVVNHHAKFYIVEVKSMQGTILTAETVSQNATSTVIKGLWPSTMYRVGVFGVDSIGQPYKSLDIITTTRAVSCGFRPSANRIVGGTVAPVNSWPWQVMVMDVNGRQFCGGSLVDRYWAVTASHCMVGETPSGVKIRLGAHYRTNGSVGTEQDIDVAEIIMHENYYTPLPESNDIALLKLVSPADLGEGAELVCLPDTNLQLHIDDLEKKCWITGWGTLFSGGPSANTLMQASVPLVSKGRCDNAYPDEIDDSMLCAGLDEGGVDACQGDSGGPLVCEFYGKWYLEGVTSWGQGCALPDKYGVYAKVREFLPWLTTNMNAPPTESPQNQSSSVLVSCNFDHGLCSGWNQSSSDDFDWTLASGSTPSSSTGPGYDQGGSGKYMYIEASSPRKPGESAKIVFTVPNQENQACLSFYYHMSGASTGTLNVYSGDNKVISFSGDQGDNWLLIERTLYLDEVVTFEGLVGSSYTGDIAIDQVKITEGSCPVSCSFDSGLCFGWTQSNSGVFNWTLASGSTSTGPSCDVTGEGKYMYIKAADHVSGDNAKLQLAVPMDYQSSSSCLEFYYHMYGASMGTLNVINGNATIFAKSGDQGDYWRQVTRTVNLSDVLIFEGIIGSPSGSDIAIDNVTLTEGACSAIISCDFDIGLCDGWRQSSLDVFDWTRHTGSGSLYTGPNGDHTSGSGYYMYTNTFLQFAGDNAKLELSVSGNGEPSCLQFYYHMYAVVDILMGNLTVFSGNTVVFSMSGNHGDNWIKAERTIYLNNTVTFEGIAGSSFSDIAVDDVSISRGKCQEHTATPALPTTTLSAPSLPSSVYPMLSTDKPSFTSTLSTVGRATLKPSLSSELTTSKVSLSSGLSTFQPSLSSSVLSGHSPTVTPQTPSLQERQESVILEVRGLDSRKWNKQMENDFRKEVARAATDYCAFDEERCQLTQSSSRRRRSSNSVVFTSDMVHILPNYPKQLPSDSQIALLAFYIQHPQGFSDGVIKKDVLKAIVESDTSSIGGSLGGTILSVQPLTSTPETTEESDEEPKSKNAIIIGASVGGAMLIVIFIAIVLRFKGRKSKGQITQTTVNNSYNNDAYYIGSGDQASKMKRVNAPDVNPQEQYYASIYSPPVPRTSNSAVALSFPTARAENSNEVSTASMYQALNGAATAPVCQTISGDAAPIYQSLNRETKIPEVRADSNSKGATRSPPTNES